MDFVRTARGRAAAALVAAVVPMTTLAVVAGPVPSAAAMPYTGPYCSDNGDTAPCVWAASVRVGGSGTPHVITSSDDTYGVSLASCEVAPDPDGSCDGSDAWSVSENGFPDPADLWSVTIDVGRLRPTTTDTRGTDAVLTRTTAPNRHNHVTVEAHPALIDDSSGCSLGSDNVFLCSNRAANSTVQLQGFISDNKQIDPAQDAADYGDDTWTTAGASGTPIWDGQPGDETLTIPAGNPHLHQDGTVAIGAYHDFLPNAILAYFGIDDPSTLTPTGLVVKDDSGDVSVTVTPSGVNIDVTDIHWPSAGAAAGVRPAAAGAVNRARVKPIRVRHGVITPTRPASLSARRTGAATAKLKVGRSRARGAKIRHYEAICVAAHRPLRRATSTRRTLHLHGLVAGVAYRCRARAVARAGAGAWTRFVRLAA